MSAFDAYFAAVEGQFRQIMQHQRSSLETAAAWVADSVGRQRFLFIFGTGHSHLLALEPFYRAGGLARVIPILDEPLMLHRSATGSTGQERQEGYAATILARYPLSEGDTLIIASNSGRNAVPIEMAQIARQKGLRVIALTSLLQSRAWPSRHSSGLKLTDVADLVLDNAAADGDAAAAVPGLAQRIGPTSTLTGALIMNLIVVGAVERLAASGHAPEIFISSNAGGDSHNQRLIAALGSVNPHL